MCLCVHVNVVLLSSALRSLSFLPPDSTGNKSTRPIELHPTLQQPNKVFDALFIENIPINLCLFRRQQQQQRKRLNLSTCSMGRKASLDAALSLDLGQSTQSSSELVRERIERASVFGRLNIHAVIWLNLLPRRFQLKALDQGKRVYQLGQIIWGGIQM